MLKVILTIWISSFVFSTNAFAIDNYTINCNNNNCFTDGWKMTANNGDYWLNNSCLVRDCQNRGWQSVDSNGNSFIVNCKAGGCFREGWYSLNRINGDFLSDEVTCKRGQCLTYGWKVKTGYDRSGGNVTCGNFDCSKYGGVSFWRGKASKTVCQDWDCYHKGWILSVF